MGGAERQGHRGHLFGRLPSGTEIGPQYFRPCSSGWTEKKRDNGVMK